MDDQPQAQDDGDHWQTMPVSELRDFIQRNSWTYAKTMPKHPHEYVLLWKCTSEDVFFRFALTIRRYGYDEYFFSKKMRYLDIDGRRYWTMGDLLATTCVLNRALNTAPDVPAVLNKITFVTNPPNKQFPPHRRG